MKHALHLAAGAFLQEIYPNSQFKRSSDNTEPGDENNGDWVNAMQSEEAGVEEELDEEGEDFDPGNLLGKVLALINQVFIFPSI